MRWWAGPTMHTSSPLTDNACCCFDSEPVTETWFELTQFSQCAEGLLVDPGTFDNLVGGLWLTRIETLAGPHGKQATFRPLRRPIAVEGVGERGSTAQREVTVPGVVVEATGKPHAADFTAPVIEDSPIPALLGLRSLRELRAVLDMINNRLILCGPGDLQFTPPPGSRTFQLKASRSGHLLLPFSDYQRLKESPETPRMLFPSTEDLVDLCRPAGETDDNKTIPIETVSAPISK